MTAGAVAFKRAEWLIEVHEFDWIVVKGSRAELLTAGFVPAGQPLPGDPGQRKTLIRFETENGHGCYDKASRVRADLYRVEMTALDGARRDLAFRRFWAAMHAPINGSTAV
jgi:hypothetical protein